MVGTGSEGDTGNKGLLKYSVVVRCTHPTPEHCGFEAALRAASQYGKSTKLGVGDLVVPQTGKVASGNVVPKATADRFLLVAGHCARCLPSYSVGCDW